MAEAPIRETSPDACVDAVIRRTGKHIVFGLPLGLGKPIHFANALYRRARQDPELKLHIVTALSLLAPRGSASLEKRFLKPFAERLYGEIPDLEFARDLLERRLPDNVKVSEFFFKAGSFINHPEQQQNYISTNYTHVVRDLLDHGVNVVGQLVARGPSEEGDRVSLSCNADLTLDLIPAMRAREATGQPVAVVAEMSDALPYLPNDASVPLSTFDLVLDAPSLAYPLFPVPQMAISPADHMIGFYASTLLKDNGTLQVGIGSLGAGLIYSALLRHENNGAWQSVYRHLDVARRFPLATRIGGTGRFEQGLYGCSEMMVDGFMHLIKAGVLTRQVVGNTELQALLNEGLLTRNVSLNTLDVLRERKLISSPLRARDVRWLQQFGIVKPGVVFRGGQLVLDDLSLVPDLDAEEARAQLARYVLGAELTGGIVMHGGFYLGPGDFYQQLRELTPAQKQRICMTSVNYINHLYDHPFGNQALKAAQRKDARLINSTMMMTLSGAAVSDGLSDGRVVSGVGGQYNFVAMAHELLGARSIMTLRSTRQSRGRTVSNIVLSYGHCTIPRHLRDIVVTEYGIADLRGKTDQEVYLALIRIADTRFQQELLDQAKKAHKVDKSFKLPAEWQQNTPEQVRAALAAAGDKQLFPPFPFGCDFTDDELKLGKALKYLKAVTGTTRGKLGVLWQALRTRPGPDEFKVLLERMDLAAPASVREKLDQRLLVLALRKLS
ncbi:MAG: acetyl-CoA hydrolase [Marinobacter sp.]|nr:acetyl-CoA hydrolase [Marinobacter sp.]